MLIKDKSLNKKFAVGLFNLLHSDTERQDF